MFRYLYIGLGITVFIFTHTNFIFAESSFSKRNHELKSLEDLLNQNDGSIPNVIVDNLTLDEYVRLGLKRNQQLKAVFYQWKASLKKVPQAFSLPDPQFSFTEYIESVETRVGPQNRAFSVKQKLPLPDKLWIRKSKSFKASESVYHRFEQIRLDIVYKITDVYYEYAYLYKAILLTKENMTLLINFESVAQSRYASGLTENQDLLKVQVELGKLESDLYTLQDRRSALMARLNALLNLPETTILPWPKVSFQNVYSKETKEEMEALILKLKKDNPQLLSMDNKVEQNKENVKLAKRAYVPDLTVGFTQVNTGDALNSSLADSGKDAQMVMFSVNVPIWFNRINAEIQEAEAFLQATESSRVNKEKELLSQLAFVHYQYSDALRQSWLYKDGLIPKAVQTLNATKTGYESGKVDFLSLIDAQRMLLNFQLSYYRHAANVQQKLAQINTLIGSIDQTLEGEK
ncbi:Heavy metal RND efflux outer membrane protein, CzcC family [hydrothermal vent metagenome]|uniref:Heavy metal RND efflux outer membrane protein, CzcC family n=1 Tax=hydrothermal vent metagenome TaxID=652676 RepID=A0A3B1D9M0_9ZZZZ